MRMLNKQKRKLSLLGFRCLSQCFLGNRECPPRGLQIFSSLERLWLVCNDLHTWFLLKWRLDWRFWFRSLHRKFSYSWYWSGTRFMQIVFSNANVVILFFLLIFHRLIFLQSSIEENLCLQYLPQHKRYTVWWSYKAGRSTINCPKDFEPDVLNTYFKNTKFYKGCMISLALLPRTLIEYYTQRIIFTNY